jgi:hypothetical protein
MSLTNYSASKQIQYTAGSVVRTGNLSVGYQTRKNDYLLTASIRQLKIVDLQEIYFTTVVTNSIPFEDMAAIATVVAWFFGVIDGTFAAVPTGFTRSFDGSDVATEFAPMLTSLQANADAAAEDNPALADPDYKAPST